MRAAVAGLSMLLVVAGDSLQAAESANGYLEAGNRALAAGNLVAARTSYEQAVQLAPQWGLAQLQLGVTLQTLDPSSSKALAALQQAARLAPTNPRAHYFLGVAYDGLQQYPAAIAEYRACQKLRPTFHSEGATVGFRLARALEKSGDATDAIAAYKAVLTRHPGHSGALAGLARLYEAAGRRKDAEAALVAIARTHPSVAYYRYRLAQFYERQGERAKARRALAEAEAIDPRPARKMRRLRPSLR